MWQGYTCQQSGSRTRLSLTSAGLCKSLGHGRGFFSLCFYDLQGTHDCVQAYMYLFSAFSQQVLGVPVASMFKVERVCGVDVALFRSLFGATGPGTV